MNSHRQLVQYGDLEQSQQTHGASSSAVASHLGHSPPSKKRKRSNQKTKRPRKTAHWDEPEDSKMNYDDTSAHGEDGEIEEEESRELTHEEIWDDSALIDAWNSATAEYEVRPVSALAFATLDTIARHSTGTRMTGSRLLLRNPPCA
jgi:hypothetical protein